MYTEINGLNYYYEEYGVGNPKTLICLHGNNESSTSFATLIPSIQDKYHIIAIDSRNHGQSSKTDQVTYIDIAFDVAVFIKKMNLKNVSIVGHSDGAIVGLFLASKLYPDIEKLYLCGINLFPGGIKTKYLWQIKAEYKKTHDPNTLMMINAPYFSKYDFGELKAQTYLIFGEHDGMKKSHVKLCARWLKNAKLMILEGEDHISYVIGSDKLKDIIDL